MQVPVWVIKGWEEFVSLCRGVTEGGKWGKEKEAKENFPRLHSIYCFIPPPTAPNSRKSIFCCFPLFFTFECLLCFLLWSLLQLCANKLGGFIKKLAINQLHSSKEAQLRNTSLNIRPMLTDSSKVVWYVCTYACKCVSHTLHKGQSAPAWKEDSGSKENTFYLPLETSAFQGWWGRWEGLVSQ